MRVRIGLLVGCAALALIACGKKEKAAKATPGVVPAEIVHVATAGVDAAAIVNADANPGEWLSHGRTYAEERYSPLGQINRGTVKELALAWSYDLGVSRGIEATPIVRDGLIYVTSTWNIVHALDARTGALKWTFDPQTDRSVGASLCCDAVNRGVAIWGDKIYTGTLDGRLIALDAKTGAKVFDVLTVDRAAPYSITGAPRIVKGKVIIGNGGAELGVRGYVSAYDAETGKMIWRFYTVPGDPSKPFETPVLAEAAKTWSGEWWKIGGGGTVWDSMAYDPGLDLLYIGVGNGSPWNQAIRSPGGGDNLFLSSIVALRPDTGEYAWHYQTTPGETWDYTATQHLVLADITIDGAARRVIMQAPKNGFFYVIDRTDGKLISAKNFVPVNWASGIDPATGRPVEIPEARWPGKAPHLQLPGPLGAHNWQPMSMSRETGLVYIPAQEVPLMYGDQAKFEYTPGRWNTGANLLLGSLPTDEAVQKAVRAMIKGRLIAWDPVKQEARWSVEHKGPWNGGLLSSAGGLVFQGTADAHFAAYDAATGAELWKQPTQTGVMAAPIAYEIDGEQYVAVAAGWGGAYGLLAGGLLTTGSAPNVGRVLVYKLGGTAKLPDLIQFTPVHVPAPETSATPETIAAGMQVYADHCAVCHGDHALSYGSVPNLRQSALLGDAELWGEVVVGGAKASAGMPDFSGAFDAQTAEAVRAYVIDARKNGLQPITDAP
ncbi:MAG: PQQ-dependent dehydrogenase, methanol/ethanol family [Parvularculaceae bacterium]